MAQLETLPDGYHLENFFTLLQYVESTYQDLLIPEETTFFRLFSDLSVAARSLYVRLVMRKGPLFRVDSLKYKDIKNRTDTLAELERSGFISIEPLVNSEQLLNLLTKAELITLFLSLSPISAATAKSQIIATVIDSVSEEQIKPLCKTITPWIERRYDRLVRRMLLLFFGNGRQGLSEFITTQLGIVNYEPYTISAESRFFKKRRRLEILEQLIDIQEWMEDKLAECDSQELIRFHEITVRLLKQSSDSYLTCKAERIITQLSRQLERLDIDRALPAYRYSNWPPSRERQARILEKQNQLDAALQLVINIEENPHHPDEPNTVSALKRRLIKGLGYPAGKTDSLDLIQHQIPTQTLILAKTEINIENNVAGFLSNEKNQCFHLENHLFCGLFGLFFWDIIFSSQIDAFFNPYQLGPRDLWSNEFYHKRRTLIDNRLATLKKDSGTEWTDIIRRHFKEKQGVANYFVHWAAWSDTLLDAITHVIPANHLAVIFTKMLENPGYYRSGFPDLLLISDNNYQLWEVKGPTDKLQSNQKRWLAYFHDQRIPAGVIHVQWQDQ